MHEDFLFELQCEELPAKSQKKLMTTLRDAFVKQCELHQLTVSSVIGFVSARHLAVYAKELSVTQPAQTIVRKGPAVQVAFDAEGQPTVQCIGFAKSLGVTPVDLQIMDVKEGQCVSYTETREGRHVRELLPGMLQACLKVFPIAKRMRWGDQPIEFLRPVHGVVALLGDELIPVTCLGQQGGRETVGHRFLSPLRFSLQHANEYVEKLLAHHVMVDCDVRQECIRHEIKTSAKQLERDAEACISDELLEEVTGLVEWPRALVGQFDVEFLQLPSEVLIAAMQDHQRYFALKGADGLLINQFVFITHLMCKDPQRIIEGNERVLRARLADARFFYEKDRQHTLLSRVERLKEVVFQQKLGTLFDKCERVKAILRDIAPVLKLDTAESELVATLMKADLLTEMVGEFPELQGVMGKYYAEQDGHSAEVARVIEEHYVPRRATVSPLGCALALADRIDTLVGLFAIGMIPTGDKDPYGLRRAALDVVGLLSKENPLNLRHVLEKSLSLYSEYASQHGVVDAVYAFILERAKHLWVNHPDYPWLTMDVYQAVMAVQPENLHDAFLRMGAVAEFRNEEAGMALAAANKRVKNSLEKALFQPSSVSDPDHFQLEQEKQLHAAMQRVHDAFLRVTTHRERLEQLAKLRKHVDDFFNHVMVMVDDDTLRNNRLHLLSELRSLFLTVADIAFLQ